MRDPERERRLLHPARYGRRRLSAVLQRKGQLGANRTHDDLGLGILEQRADDAGQLADAVLPGIHPGDHHAPSERAAMKVRHEPAGRAQQR